MSLTAPSSFYELEEASGTRNDSTAAAMHLTDNNTVTQVAGKVGNAAQFTAANGEFLSHVDAVALRTGDIDHTWAGWFKINAFPTGSNPIITKCDAGGTTYEYFFNVNVSTAKFVAQLFNGIGGVLVLSITSTPAIVVGNWYFWVFKFNATTGVGKLKINDGTADEATKTGTPGSGGDFNMGGRNDAVSADHSHNGPQDQVGLWKNYLTTDEEDTWLYNAGAGRTYAEVLAGMVVATPAISPAAGAILSTDDITITCATSGASIYYTIDGSAPDATKTLYSGAFQLASDATVKAIAIKTLYTDSAVASSAFTVTAPQTVGGSRIFGGSGGSDFTKNEGFFRNQN